MFVAAVREVPRVEAQYPAIFRPVKISIQLVDDLYRLLIQWARAISAQCTGSNAKTPGTKSTR